MDPQKSPTSGVAPEGQNDQNEVSVNLNTVQAQSDGLQAPSQDGSALAADASQAQSDFTTPSAPVADPGTSFSPTPVTDMQSGNAEQPAAPVPQDVQADLAQVATAQAGVEVPADVQQATDLPQAPVAMDPSAVPSTPEQSAMPAPGADPATAAASTDTPAAHSDKKVIIILSIVAVVLLAAIAVLYVM